jgi:hypothetical protein
VITFDPGVGEPQRWILCFSQTCATPWLNRLPVGRFKHVRAFGCVPALNTWLFYDPALDRSSMTIARGESARILMANWLRVSEAIEMPMVKRNSMVPRIGGWCVPAIKHLVGIRGGALRPDALWRECLRQGGEVIATPKLHTAAA